MEDKISALNLYRKAINLNTNDTEATLSLATILVDLEQFHPADSMIAKALTIDPHSRNFLTLKARCDFEQKKHDKVIQTINTLLKRADTTVLYARMMGISYFNLKDYNNTVTCMNFLLKNRYEGESVYYYLGIASRELGFIPASIEYLKLAVQHSISENIVSYYTNLGQSYEKLGNHKAAINAYREAYDFSKKGILLYHLARNYDINYKDKSRAVEYYKKYLASDDTTRVVRDYARKRMQDMGYF